MKPLFFKPFYFLQLSPVFLRVVSPAQDAGSGVTGQGSLGILMFLRPVIQCVCIWHGNQKRWRKIMAVLEVAGLPCRWHEEMAHQLGTCMSMAEGKPLMFPPTPPAFSRTEPKLNSRRKGWVRTAGSEIVCGWCVCESELCWAKSFLCTYIYLHGPCCFSFELSDFSGPVVAMYCGLWGLLCQSSSASHLSPWG